MTSPYALIRGASMGEGASGRTVFPFSCLWTLRMLSGAMLWFFTSAVYCTIFWVTSSPTSEQASADDASDTPGEAARLPHFPRRDVVCPFLITSRLGWNTAAILAPERQKTHRVPSGCSVVSVDPVGLAAATSGYWVSAGGHVIQDTWWWIKVWLDYNICNIF